MKFCISINRKMKQKPTVKAEKKYYIEMYDGNPRYVVTDINMYDEGYVQAGFVNGIKRWELKHIDEYDRLLIEVNKNERRS